MKILTALKKIKHLDRKIGKTQKRIADWCSFVVENDKDPGPDYNADDISKMMQQVADWAGEKVRIRKCLHRTNVEVEVEWDGQKRSIDELLLIQNITLPTMIFSLRHLRRKEKNSSFGHKDKDAYVVLQYDPRERDRAIEKLEYKKDELDALLDNLNIETDVIGLD